MYTREQVMTAYKAVWERYPTAKCIDFTAMGHMILHILDEYAMPTQPAFDEILNHISEEYMNGGMIFFVKGGKNAGYYRNQASMPRTIPAHPQDTGNWERKHMPGINPPPTLRNPVHPALVEQTSFLHVPPTTETVINDHICPCCGNDRVSKQEKSCWKCGGSL